MTIRTSMGIPSDELTVWKELLEERSVIFPTHFEAGFGTTLKQWSVDVGNGHRFCLQIYDVSLRLQTRGVLFDELGRIKMDSLMEVGPTGEYRLHTCIAGRWHLHSPAHDDEYVVDVYEVHGDTCSEEEQ